VLMSIPSHTSSLNWAIFCHLPPLFQQICRSILTPATYSRTQPGSWGLRLIGKPWQDQHRHFWRLCQLQPRPGLQRQCDSRLASCEHWAHHLTSRWQHEQGGTPRALCTHVRSLCCNSINVDGLGSPGSEAETIFTFHEGLMHFFMHFTGTAAYNLLGPTH
jgi:hypothetical protein